MELDYPNYIGKKNEIINNTGNAIIPEGTVINWKLYTKQTDTVRFINKDSSYLFSKEDSYFNLKKKINSTQDYIISTSNALIKNYENLSYTLEVIKDQFPDIKLLSKPDSLNNQIIYFLGKVSDDYGLSKLQLVYKKKSDVNYSRVNLPLEKSNYFDYHL